MRAEPSQGQLGKSQRELKTLGCDSVDVRGPGFNSQAMPTAKTEKAEQNKKATPKSHQRALAALTRDEQGTGTLLSRE